jgi:hypothetical protein
LSGSGGGFFDGGATCFPGANAWEVYDVRRFSAHGVGVYCNPMQSPRLKVGKVGIPDGQTLSFKGEFFAPTPVDPVVHGLGVTLYDVATAAFDTVVPPGAFDPVTKAGWKAHDGEKWTYKNRTASRSGGITRVSLRSLGSFSYLVSVKAKRISFTSTTPYAEFQVVLPGTGACQGRSFPGGGGPVCVRRGRTLSCK